MNEDNKHFFVFDFNKSMKCCCNGCKSRFNTSGIKIPTYEEILNKRIKDFYLLQKKKSYSKLFDTHYPHNHVLSKNGTCIELLNFTNVKDLSLRICPYGRRLKNTVVLDKTICTECRSSSKTYFYHGQSSSDRSLNATLLKICPVKTGFNILNDRQ